MTYVARWMHALRNGRLPAASRRRFRTRRLRCERLERRDLLATIQGAVFEDLHGDGARDSGDPDLELAGIEVYLDQNNSGALDAGEVSTTTDAGGAYEFTGLAAGDYIVRQIAPAGYRQTSPAPDPGPGEFGDSLATIDLAGKLPGQARRLAYSTGTLFQQSSDGTITEIDAQTGTVLSQFTQPSGIQDITHDGTSLWGVRDGELVAFDAGGVSNVLSINVPNATALAWDGNVFWVSDSSADILYRINPSDGSTLPDPIAAPGAGQGTLVNLTHDGTSLWIRRVSTPNRVFEVDPSSGTALRSLDIETSSGGSAFDFDRQALWTTYEDAQLLVLVDVSKPGANVTTVGGADTVSGVDFGNFELATVSGVVFEDADGDGVQDAGEIGLAGWRVFVDTIGNGLAENFESSVITGADGSYSLALGPGSHDVTAQLREPGWQPTLPDPALTTVTVTTSGEMATADFGHVLNGIGPVGAEIDVAPSLITSSTSHMDVSSDVDGNFAVTWGGNGAGGDGLWVRSFDAAGNPLSSEILVTDTTSLGYVAMAGDGHFAVVWGHQGQLFAPDGARLGDEFSLGKGKTDDLHVRGIDMSADGDFAVLLNVDKGFFGSSELAVQRLDAAGNPIGSRTKVADPNLINGGEDIAIDAAGNVVVAWGDDQLYAQRLDSAGNLVGSTFFVGGAGRDPGVEMTDDGRFVIAWTDGLKRFARVYSADAAPLINTSVVADFGGDSSVGIDAQGNVVVVYAGNGHQHGRAFGRRIDASGNIGDEFQINTTLGNDIGWEGAAVTVLPSGAFVSAWRLGGPDSIHAQIYGDTVPAPPMPTFTIDDVTLAEGDSGQTAATFTVTRSGLIDVAASVEVATSDGSATVADGDYAATPTTLLSFSAGETEKTVTVLVNGDENEESDETFFVNLANASSGAAIDDPQGVGTIVNDDVSATASDIYVWDVEFDSRTRGKGSSKHDERILVTIRSDSDGDGVAEASDAVVAGASVTIEVRDSAGALVAVLSGTTDSNGVFTSDWLLDLPDDTYTATVTAVSHPDYTWNDVLDYDPDGNGFTDETHTIPHGASAAATSEGAVDSAFADEKLLDDLTTL